MRNENHNLEILLYFLASTIAILVRFLFLGNAPLSDQEASLALESLRLTGGARTIFQPFPFLIIFNGFLFSVFNASNFIARLLPAFFGTALVISPILYRDLINKKAAIILAFIFAVDPLIVAYSRVVDGTIIALVSLIFFLGFLLKKKPVAGLFLGIAFFSTPDFWQGFMLCVIFCLIYWLLNREQSNNFIVDLKREKTFRNNFLFFLGSAFLLFGCFFLIYPTGISAAFSGIKIWIEKFWLQSIYSFPSLLVMLPIYQSLGIIIGLIAAGLSLRSKDRLDLVLSISWIISFFFLLIQQGRSVTDLLWISLPMWLLAARLISRVSIPGITENLPFWGQVLLVIVLISFIGLNGLSLVNSTLAENEQQIRLTAILGAFLLLALSTGLLCIGWSWQEASFGLLFGFFVVLGLFTVSLLLNSGRSSGIRESSLLNADYEVEGEDILLRTTSDLSEWKTGIRNRIDISLAGLSSPSLEWSLRDFRELDKAVDIPVNASASIVITPKQQTLASSNSYRGQQITWSSHCDQNKFGFVEWVKWIAYRKCPQVKNEVILWARNDIFPQGASK